MAAPIFSESEVNRLLALSKRIRRDEWDQRAELKEGRDTPNELHARIRALAPEAPELRYTVELRKSISRPEFSATLMVSTNNLRNVAICRYDLQPAPHHNPSWFHSPRIEPKAPHKHVYNPRAVREGVSDDWERCAEPLVIPHGGNFRGQIQRLKKVFLDELNIEFDDKDLRQGFLVQP